jgi:hypothetical protein
VKEDHLVHHNECRCVEGHGHGMEVKANDDGGWSSDGVVL